MNSAAREPVPKTVLVVDDEEADRVRLAAILAGAGFEVLEAPNGESAARIYVDRRIDVVVTDIVMPEGDGVGLIRWLRHLQPDAAVIAVSGKGPSGLATAKALGAACVLAKPVEPDALVRAVSAGVRSSRRKRA